MQEKLVMMVQVCWLAVGKYMLLYSDDVWLAKKPNYFLGILDNIMPQGLFT